MLHIQIVLYNSIKNLEKLITALNIAYDEKIKFLVHFLENSEENSLEFIKSKNLKFEYTYDNEKENFGFGKGHNFLFDKYKKNYAEYFLILNPDTLPFYNFLTELHQFIDKISKNWGIIELNQFINDHPKEVSDKFETHWAHGAATVFRTEVFEKVDKFDENIFMYCEDVDISWRIREMEWQIYSCPTSKIAHITQNLDLDKDNTFERIHSFAGGLYLRYKYFGEKEVENYKNLIKGAEKDYEQAVEFFDSMKRKLSEKELVKYRKFRSPEIYPDGNYAKHRW